jgi:hypothetical protein
LVIPEAKPRGETTKSIRDMWWHGEGGKKKERKEVWRGKVLMPLIVSSLTTI